MSNRIHANLSCVFIYKDCLFGEDEWCTCSYQTISGKVGEKKRKEERRREEKRREGERREEERRDEKRREEKGLKRLYRENINKEKQKAKNI